MVKMQRSQTGAVTIRKWLLLYIAIYAGSCSIAASTNPGTCPAVEGGTFGICIAACSSDVNCADDEKCCSNGCGHTCQKATPPVASLKCPMDECSSTEMSCDKDEECSPGLWCCGGCCRAKVCEAMDCSDGDVCRAVPVQCIMAPCPTLPMCVNSKLQCPRHQYMTDRTKCVNTKDLCGGDGACSVSEKCCFDGCSKRCLTAEDNEPVRDGYCPAYDHSLNNQGLCSGRQNECSSYSDCPGDEMCCEHACGKSCIRPKVCPKGDPLNDYNGNQLFCGRGPSTVECPAGSQCFIEAADAYAVCCADDKVGECPAVPEGTVGSCVNLCTRDGNCPGDQKCCSYGCGLTCQIPKVCSSKDGI